MSSSSALRLKHSTTKKHIEYFFWVYAVVILLTSTSSSLLMLTWLFTCLVIVPPFLRISKTSICCRYFLKSIWSLWCVIFIRMELYCQFFIRLFKIIFCCVPRHSQNFIVIFLSYYFLGYFLLSWGVLWLLRCFLCWWRCFGLF